MVFVILHVPPGSCCPDFLVVPIFFDFGEMPMTERSSPSVSVTMMSMILNASPGFSVRTNPNADWLSLIVGLTRCSWTHPLPNLHTGWKLSVPLDPSLLHRLSSCVATSSPNASSPKRSPLRAKARQTSGRSRTRPSWRGLPRTRSISIKR